MLGGGKLMSGEVKVENKYNSIPQNVVQYISLCYISI